jgi:hypothetical protein
MTAQQRVDFAALAYPFKCTRCDSRDVFEGFRGLPTCCRCRLEFEPDGDAEYDRWELRCRLDLALRRRHGNGCADEMQDAIEGRGEYADNDPTDRI